MSVSVIVVKIGGSLFTQPNMVPRLIERINCLSSQYSPSHLVLVTGGGSFVDSLRKIDEVNQVSCEVAHWTAIHLMDVNSALLQKWWPELQSVDSLDELRLRCKHSGITLFRVEEFLRHDEPSLPGNSLPVGWEVTSDSISARIAEILGARQLILLKPISSTHSQNWDAMVESGLVDRFFPSMACQIEEIIFDSLKLLEGSA